MGWQETQKKNVSIGFFIFETFGSYPSSKHQTGRIKEGFFPLSSLHFCARSWSKLAPFRWRRGRFFKLSRCHTQETQRSNLMEAVGKSSNEREVASCIICFRPYWMYYMYPQYAIIFRSVFWDLDRGIPRTPLVVAGQIECYLCSGTNFNCDFCNKYDCGMGESHGEFETANFSACSHSEGGIFWSA